MNVQKHMAAEHACFHDSPVSRMASHGRRLLLALITTVTVAGRLLY